MSICIETDAIKRVLIQQMDLATLADLSSDELQRHRLNGSYDESYSVELLRRALVTHSDMAWSLLQQCFSETLRNWIWSHPGRDVALLRDSEENYIAQTFTRFWLAVRDQHIEFTTLSAISGYLHATLNGLLTDTLRFHLRGRTREAPLPASGCFQEPAAPDYHDGQSTWESIASLLPDERERRLAYLLYHCGLKPRDIVRRCSPEFPDVQEIYRLNHNIVERLRRNRDRLRYILGGDA